jgi:hypothetical protein
VTIFSAIFFVARQNTETKQEEGHFFSSKSELSNDKMPT